MQFWQVRCKICTHMSKESPKILTRRNLIIAGIPASLVGATAAAQCWATRKETRSGEPEKPPVLLFIEGEAVTFPRGVVLNLTRGLQMTIKPKIMGKLTANPDVGINLPENYQGIIAFAGQMTIVTQEPRPQVARRLLEPYVSSLVIKYINEQALGARSGREFVNIVSVQDEIRKYPRYSPGQNLAIAWAEAMREGAAFIEGKEYRLGLPQKAIEIIVHSNPIEVLNFRENLKG